MNAMDLSRFDGTILQGAAAAKSDINSGWGMNSSWKDSKQVSSSANKGSINQTYESCRGLTGQRAEVSSILVFHAVSLLFIFLQLNHNLFLDLFRFFKFAYFFRSSNICASMAMKWLVQVLIAFDKVFRGWCTIHRHLMLTLNIWLLKVLFIPHPMIFILLPMPDQL